MKYLFVALLLIPFLLKAQTLNCTVTIEHQNLEVSNMEVVDELQQKIDDYMNKNSFAEKLEDLGKINCAFHIFLIDANDQGDFNAQVNVVSSRKIYKSNLTSPILNLLDNQWSFHFTSGQNLESSQLDFDPLTSFLDYYAYLIIGYNEDSWERLSGDDYFQKAADIVDMGATSRRTKGWKRNTNSYSYSRSNLIDDILNETYRPFREAFYNYHYGIDIYNTDKEKAWKYIIQMIDTTKYIEDLTSTESTIITVFYDAKSGEITDRLADYPDNSIWEKLKIINPSHADEYNEAEQK